jgi:hypothetical protein
MIIMLGTSKKQPKTDKIDESVISERIDARGNPTTQKIHLRQDKKTKESLIMLQESHKSQTTGKQRFGSVFFLTIKSAIEFIKKLFVWSKKYNIDLSELNELNKESTEKISKELSLTKLKLEEAEHNITTLSLELSKREEQFKKNRDVDFTSKIPQFKSEIKDFEDLIAGFEQNKKKEEDLQIFLEGHPWFLSLYYKDFTPQKLSGMTSRFDFYLKRFDDSQEVIELKRVDAKFVNKDYSISSDFAQAVDQMLRYFDDILDITFSPRLSKKFNIQEFYPHGILVFGFKPNEKVKHFIRRWSNAVRIDIFTYNDILDRFKTTVKNLETVNKQ